MTTTATSPARGLSARTLPLVDLEAAHRSARERADLLTRLRAAAHGLGFFYVTGHGIPQGVEDDLLAATRTFFALPEDERRRISNTRSPHFRGYTSLATEHTAGAPDAREQLDIGPERAALELGPDDPAYLRLVGPNQWPEGVPELRPAVLRYQAEAGRVARSVLALLAEALGESPTWFERWFDDEAVETTKLVRYPAPPVSVVPADAGQGVGAHKDYGWLALVLQDEHQGLEVRTDDGDWIEATPVRGTLVVNVGEALEVATGGYLRANVHRVVAPRDGADRYSVPSFLAPRYDAVVEPLTLPAELAAAARGVEQDPANPIYAEYGRKALVGWLRSHPEVARRHHADLLGDPQWNPGR
ncbi:isopenicillin N synthase family dioxygenase [Oryzobacter terrae]|uniref:isopenicillin N synthase family dioxygenase n=1 Tax=Oryzobacter terrae TaxID=1620385 RepID=UPI00366BB78B